jgi:signal peptidase I
LVPDNQANIKAAPPKGYAKLPPTLRGRAADVLSLLAPLACVVALFAAPTIDGVWLRLPVLLALIALVPVAWLFHRRRADRSSPILRGGLAVAVVALSLLAMAMHHVSGFTSLAGLLAFFAALALRGAAPKALIKGRDLRVGERKPMAVLFENIESLASALVIVLLVWHFGLEAFRIPSGSMAPTLLGDVVWGDRVLVDKTPYLWRDPRRWEPVVFRYPLRRGEPYVKRCIGLPGEQILIAGGDIYMKANEGAEIELLTKSGRVREVLWFPYVGSVSDRTEWIKHFHRSGAADFDDGVVVLGSGGVATFPLKGGAPGDAVDHDASFGATEPAPFGLHVVGDLRIRGVARLEGGKALAVKLIRDEDEYTLELKAGAGGCALFRNGDGSERQPLHADGLSALEVPERAEFAFSLADGELQVVVDGHVRTIEVGTALLEALRKRDAQQPISLAGVEALKIAGAAPANGSRGRIELRALGEKAELEVLGIERDIYYVGRKLDQRGPDELPFQVALGDDQYLVLGDNSPGSADCRFWIRITLTLEDGTQITGSLDDPTQPELAALLRGPRDDPALDAYVKLFKVTHFTPAERGEAGEDADTREMQEALEMLKKFADSRGRGAFDFWTEGGGFTRVSLKDVQSLHVEPHPYVQRNLFVGRPFAVFLSPRGMKLID